jgi:hypothetical protein
MVIVLASLSKVRRFKPGRDRFLRATRINSTPSFGRKLKPSAHVRIHGVLKIP